jgi:hypothetical protein
MHNSVLPDTIAIIKSNRAMIAASNGRIFSAAWIKKNGEIRRGAFRLETTVGTNGKGMRYNAADRGLMTVYDMKNRGYRMITLANLLEYKCGDVHWATVV